MAYFCICRTVAIARPAAVLAVVAQGEIRTGGNDDG